MTARAGHIVTVADFGTTLFALKTSDESVASSTTLQNDDQLVLSVAANAKYRMIGYIVYDGAADPAGGLKLQFTGPSGATMPWTNFGANISGASQYNVVVEQLAAASPRSVPTNNGVLMSCAPKGLLVVSSTAGSLQLKWAQNSSSATATVVKANSWLELVRVA
jgi:hypothetical protein